MRKRTVGYDAIRILSIFLVVVIHSNVAYLGANKGTPSWYFVMLMTSVCLVAVPMFFMVSGALLLDTDDIISLDKLFFKRIMKQAIPFVIWSLVYVLARIVMGKIPFGITAFTDLLHEPAYYQFWFMYSLLAIYLLLPVLQAVVIKLDKKQLEYVLLIWVLFSAVFPVLQRFVPGFAISSHVDLILCEGYVGYFLLGHYLRKYCADVTWKKGAVLAIVGIVITGVSSVVEYMCGGAGYAGYFYQAYLTPFVVLASTGLFLVFVNLRYTENERVRTLLKTGAMASIGVYYLHMLVLTVLEYVGFVGDNNVLILVFKAIITYGVSLAAALVMLRIPRVKSLLLGVK